jgi:hypothetical protein
MSLHRKAIGIFAIAIIVGACLYYLIAHLYPWRIEKQVDIAWLFDGDYRPDRIPPFIPSKQLQAIVESRVCIHGDVIYLANGQSVLMRYHERFPIPLHVIALPNGLPQLSQKVVPAAVRGMLRIRPHYTPGGDLATVYELQNINIDPDPDPIAVSVKTTTERSIIRDVGSWVIAVVAMTAPLALIWGIFLRHSRAKKWRLQVVRANKCVACGYDLTGNVTQICPECGTLAL